MTDVHSESGLLREALDLYQSVTAQWVHAQQVRWTLLYNFLVATSILLLVWATVLNTQLRHPWKLVVLSSVCVVGVVKCALWISLSERGNVFVKMFDKIGRDIEFLFPRPLPRPFQISENVVRPQLKNLGGLRAKTFFKIFPVVVLALYLLLMVASIRFAGADEAPPLAKIAQTATSPGTQIANWNTVIALYGPLILTLALVVIGYLGLKTGRSALAEYKTQAWAATREHMNNVHLAVFQRLDAPEVRGARHYVYAMDTIWNAARGEFEDRKPLDLSNLTFQRQQWLLLGTPDCPGTEEEQKPWKENKAKAEIMARALDQLGYLVREGIVPINVVARFYTYPALRCWYQLCPYIEAVRKTRKQPGHMWEWENLVNKIIVGARSGEGIWKGTADHDNLKEYTTKITERTARKDFPRDEVWNPPDQTIEMQLPYHKR